MKLQLVPEVVDFIDPGLSQVITANPLRLIRNEKVACSIHVSGTKLACIHAGFPHEVGPNWGASPCPTTNKKPHPFDWMRLFFRLNSGSFLGFGWKLDRTDT